MVDKITIMLAGYKGSGKTTICDIFQESHGAKIIRLGGFIDEYVQRIGLELNPENKKKYSEKLLAESPNGSLIHYLFQTIESQQGIVLIDSGISINDFTALKAIDNNATLCYVEAISDEWRHRKIITRCRADDYFRVEDIKRLEADVNPKISLLRNIADYVIQNQGEMVSLRKETRKMIDKLRG